MSLVDGDSADIPTENSDGDEDAVVRVLGGDAEPKAVQWIQSRSRLSQSVLPTGAVCPTACVCYPRVHKKVNMMAEVYIRFYQLGFGFQ